MFRVTLINPQVVQTICNVAANLRSSLFPFFYRSRFFKIYTFHSSLHHA